MRFDDWEDYLEWYFSVLESYGYGEEGSDE